MIFQYMLLYRVLQSAVALDSASFTSVVKISYADSRGYVKKVILEF